MSENTVLADVSRIPLPPFVGQFLTWFLLNPKRRSDHRTPLSELGLPFETWTLESMDGITLAAWHVPHPSPRGVCVLSHGYEGTKGNMLAYASALHPLGFAIVMHDFRGHGQSSGRGTTCGLNEPRDLSATIDAARAAYPTLPIVLLGESMGAAVTLMTAAQRDDIDAVIADCPFALLDEAVGRRLETILGPKLGRICTQPTLDHGAKVLGVHPSVIGPEPIMHLLGQTPLLLVHGTADFVIPLTHAYRIADAYPGSPDLWIVEGTGHVTTIQKEFNRYQVKLEAFLRPIGTDEGGDSDDKRTNRSDC